MGRGGGGGGPSSRFDGFPSWRRGGREGDEFGEGERLGALCCSEEGREAVRPRFRSKTTDYTSSEEREGRKRTKGRESKRRRSKEAHLVVHLRPPTLPEHLRLRTPVPFICHITIIVDNNLLPLPLLQDGRERLNFPSLSLRGQRFIRLRSSVGEVVRPIVPRSRR